MLELIFYGSDDQTDRKYMEVSESFYEWLARADFSKIGKSVDTKIKSDDEVEIIPLVKLESTTRERMRFFCLEAISQESDLVLEKLADSTSKFDYYNITYRLRKLQELRKLVEDKTYIYLQRI